MSKKDKQTELIQYAASFQQALVDVITNEENEYHIEVKSDDITDILTGMCMGFLTTLGKLTRQRGNYLDNISMVNKLIVQYLMKYGAIDESKEDEE
jgi:hypothetical protein